MGPLSAARDAELWWSEAAEIDVNIGDMPPKSGPVYFFYVIQVTVSDVRRGRIAVIIAGHFNGCAWIQLCD
jgi:hypothetical protein